MREAIALAVAGVAGGGGPFGAVVVRDGHVIGRGNNRVTASHDPTAHAEVVAIRAACQELGSFSLEGCELYASCEPCPMCLGAILWARLDRVYFAASRGHAAQAGFDDAAFYEEVGRPVEVRELPMSVLLPDEADAPFAAWRGHDGRVPY